MTNENHPYDASASNHFGVDRLIRALDESGLANEVVWVKDGQEALDYLYKAGAHADRPPGGRGVERPPNQGNLVACIHH